MVDPMQPGGSDLYAEAESQYARLLQAGTGRICDAAEVCVSADGVYAVFTGTLVDRLEGAARTRICRTNLSTGSTEILTSGPNSDRSPKCASDGRTIAFLSDRACAGDFQLHLLDTTTHAVRSVPCPGGWVEYLHWSGDSRRILLGVAGHGADLSSSVGAVTTKRIAERKPSWFPLVDRGGEACQWRRAWIYDVDRDSLLAIPAGDRNIWEASWCGDSAITAVVSHGPQEGLWYSAILDVIDVQTGSGRTLHVPRDQLGLLTASPSGKQVAVIEALCSDRAIVAGELLLIDLENGNVRRAQTHGVDISCVEWRSDRFLLLAGHRGFETVAALYDVSSGTFTELWASTEITTGGYHATACGWNEPGDFVLVGESYVRAPEIAVVQRGRYRTVMSFAPADVGEIEDSVKVGRVSWQAADGLEINAWLLRPRGSGPCPTVMQIHGGPVLHWRPSWLGRWRSVLTFLLVMHGFAVFLPNPRGSSGRGQEFARQVLGDMGGADARDLLSGIDHLVSLGIADPARLCVMGASYGGYMTARLITQDPRFAAAVPVAPVTNRVSASLLSNIPEFTDLFLADHFTNLGGKFYERSPIMHAHKTRTPTLNVCGALDRCTPPIEAAQFHNALLRNGVTSVLVTYPEEGHGIRKFPALIDYAARVVAWFEQHAQRTTT